MGVRFPRLRSSSVSLAASDRTDAAIAKPETPFGRVDELGDQISGNALACLAPGQKAGFEREIGFGGFEHLAAPSSPSPQRRGLSGRSHLPSKQIQKVAESGFPDEGKNFPDRSI